MESFYSCASFLLSADHGFAASGLPPDCRTAGLRLDSHARILPVPVLVGDARTIGSSGGRVDGPLSYALDPGRGSNLRVGEGDILWGSVNSALLDGMMPR